MFELLLFSGVIYAVTFCVIGGENNSNCNNKCSSYPSGLELKRELRRTPIYDYDVSNLNYDLIEEYIFRDYVYNFEKFGGYSREVSIRKALDKYIKTYKILDEKYKFSKN